MGDRRLDAGGERRPCGGERADGHDRCDEKTARGRHDSLRMPAGKRVPVRLDHGVDQLRDRLGRKRRRGVRVEQHRVAHMGAVAFERRADGQLADVQERAVERRELRGQRADRRGLHPVSVDEARNLDARTVRQVRDQPVVSDVPVDDPRLSGRDRVDDQRGVLEAALDLERPAGRQRPPHLGVELEVLLAPAHVLVDGHAEPLDHLVASHEPRQVLGRVLAGLGREVPEPPVHLDAHPPAQLGVAARWPGREAGTDPVRHARTAGSRPGGSRPRRGSRPPRTGRRRSRPGRGSSTARSGTARRPAGSASRRRSPSTASPWGSCS